MNFLNKLPREIILSVAFFLKLKDIQHLSSMCKESSFILEEMNWLSYVSYHTQASPSVISRAFGPILNIQFMKDHGIWIMNKGHYGCIEQYLSIWKVITHFDVIKSLLTTGDGPTFFDLLTSEPNTYPTGVSFCSVLRLNKGICCEYHLINWEPILTKRIDNTEDITIAIRKALLEKRYTYLLVVVNNVERIGMIEINNIVGGSFSVY